ncbi:MAG: hypothetical protein H0U60_09070 [Blastocatellia bacterium]|nr:hypothetical protein [Blastocatellia bacterium]
MIVQLSEVEVTGALRRFGAIEIRFYVRLFIINARAIAKVRGVFRANVEIAGINGYKALFRDLF